MIFLLMLVFGSRVSGLSREAEEGQDVLLQWRSPRPLDLSLLTINCESTPSTKKMIVMRKGKRRREEEAAQFSGRVQCDTDALKQGQVELRLSRLQQQDTGLYHCEMSAADTEQTWGFRFYEQFTIKVLHRPAPTTKGKVKERPGDAVTQHPQKNNSLYMILIIPFVIVIVILIVFWILRRRKAQQKIIKQTNTTKDSSDDTPESSCCVKFKDPGTKREFTLVM